MIPIIKKPREKRKEENGLEECAHVELGDGDILLGGFHEAPDTSFACDHVVFFSDGFGNWREAVDAVGGFVDG